MAKKADETIGTEDIKVVERKASARLNVRESQRKELVKFYKAEERVPVTISPFYAPHFGKVVSVLVNGIRVSIPADGRTYKINKTHADEVVSKIRKIDKFMDRQKRAADISSNVERSIGELEI